MVVGAQIRCRAKWARSKRKCPKGDGGNPKGGHSPTCVGRMRCFADVGGVKFLLSFPITTNMCTRAIYFFTFHGKAYMIRSARLGLFGAELMSIR